MRDVLKIANAQAFWGDSPEAPATLVSQVPDLDYLTLDYLAEVSMSILAKQRARDPQAGYANDFLDVITSLTPHWRAGHPFKLITNAGGLNPTACAHATAKLLREANRPHLRIAVITGDDVLPILQAAASPPPSPGTPGEGRGEGFPPTPSPFSHLETNAPLSSIAQQLTTANAYLGAAPLVDALARGAHLVITGRVADPSLTVAPAAHHFRWPATAYDQLAGATVAGHLIECGPQVTGGIGTDWLDLPDPAHIGYPIVEVFADGSCVVTKPDGTGGRVDQAAVKEQLLYELGDPAHYLSPDATVSFLSLRLQDDGPDRVRVSGATGRPPPGTYKVSATYRAGFRAAATLTLFGRDAVRKARRCGEIVRQRLRDAGADPQHYLVECLGAGDVVPNILKPYGACSVGSPECATELVLRLTAADPRRDVVERFTREIMPLIASGPQGTTGYAEGRPPVREVFHYWPTLIPRNLVHPRVEIIDV